MKLEYASPMASPHRPRWWLRYLLMMLVGAALYWVAAAVLVAGALDNGPSMSWLLAVVIFPSYFIISSGPAVLAIFAVTFDGCFAGAVITAIWHILYKTRGFWRIDVD
ncbi:MAG TPA: hypothetical protein VHY37_12985 [Tepidisphaeraceae bacterium]|nr:hypothetical protein [Tepidisphaeraceae bacterium]